MSANERELSEIDKIRTRYTSIQDKMNDPNEYFFLLSDLFGQYCLGVWNIDSSNLFAEIINEFFIYFNNYMLDNIIIKFYRKKVLDKIEKTGLKCLQLSISIIDEMMKTDEIRDESARRRQIWNENLVKYLNSFHRHSHSSEEARTITETILIYLCNYHSLFFYCNTNEQRKPSNFLFLSQNLSLDLDFLKPPNSSQKIKLAAAILITLCETLYAKSVIDEVRLYLRYIGDKKCEEREYLGIDTRMIREISLSEELYIRKVDANEAKELMDLNLELKLEDDTIGTLKKGTEEGKKERESKGEETDERKADANDIKELTDLRSELKFKDERVRRLNDELKDKDERIEKLIKEIQRINKERGSTVTEFDKGNVNTKEKKEIIEQKMNDETIEKLKNKIRKIKEKHEAKDKEHSVTINKMEEELKDKNERIEKLNKEIEERNKVKESKVEETHYINSVASGNAMAAEQTQCDESNTNMTDPVRGKINELNKVIQRKIEEIKEKDDKIEELYIMIANERELKDKATVSLIDGVGKIREQIEEWRETDSNNPVNIAHSEDVGIHLEAEQGCNQSAQVQASSLHF